MGVLFSCCRRSKPPRLLGPETDQFPDRDQDVLLKLASLLAALKTRKLPSTSQLNSLLAISLQSSFLSASSNEEQFSGWPSELRQAVVEFKTSLKDAVQAAINFGLEKNGDDLLQETYWLLSTQLPASSAPPIHVDLQSLPSTSSAQEVETDTQTLLLSLRTLLPALLSSSTFHMLLSDLSLLARQLLWLGARKIGTVAARTEAATAEVQEAVTYQPDLLTGDVLRSTADDAFGSMRAAGAEQTDTLPEETAEATREIVVNRILSITTRALRPSTRTSLLALLELFEKYSSSLSTEPKEPEEKTQEFKGSVRVSPTLETTLWNTKILLERLASETSLDPLLSSLKEISISVAALSATTTSSSGSPQDEQERQLISSVKNFLSRALSDPKLGKEYLNSSEGRQAAGEVYDLFLTVFASSDEEVEDAEPGEKVPGERPHSLVHSTRATFQRANEFLSAIKADRQTNALLHASSALQTSFLRLSQCLTLSTPSASSSLSLLLSYLLPHLLHIFKKLPLPLPRVEYTSPQLQAAVDTLLLRLQEGTGAGSLGAGVGGLLPERVGVRTWTDLEIDMAPPEPSSTDALLPTQEPLGTKTKLKTHLSVELSGLRLSAHNVAFYASYAPWLGSPLLRWIGWEEEGLVSVDVGGGSSGTGVGLEFELAYSSQEEEEELFEVTSAKAHIPSGTLHLTLPASKHWILNNLLVKPIVQGPMGRGITENVFGSGMLGGLQGAERTLRGIWLKAKERAPEGEQERRAPGMWDWIGALLDTLSSGEGEQEQEETEEDNTEIETTTTLNPASLGMVRTSVTHHRPSVDRSRLSRVEEVEEEETAIAIGVTPQLLPDHADPVPRASLPGILQDSIVDEMTPLLQHANEAAGVDVGEELRGAAVRAVNLRQGVKAAEERFVQQERVERRTGRKGGKERGWRSGAFNLDF